MAGDTTHWRLADGSDVELLNYLDDHSRLLVACVAFRTLKGADVVQVFYAAAEEHGFPASLHTDNGAVFTGASRKAKVLLETELDTLGIVFKHSTPYHPQTCRKVESFHQTLKRYLAKQAPPQSLAHLQLQLDTFRAYYNHHRPHRALGSRTPLVAFNDRLTAHPAQPTPTTDFRVRTDLKCTVTVRYLSRLRHIPLGAAHRYRPVTLPVAGRTSASSPRTAHCCANSLSIPSATTSRWAPRPVRLDSHTMT